MIYSDLKTGGKGYFYFASLLNLRVPLQCLFLLHELFLSETTQRLGTLCCAFVNVSFEKNNCCHKLSGASAVVFFFVQRNNNKNKAHSSCAKKQVIKRRPTLHVQRVQGRQQLFSTQCHSDDRAPSLLNIWMKIHWHHIGMKYVQVEP